MFGEKAMKGAAGARGGMWTEEGGLLLLSKGR